MGFHQLSYVLSKAFLSSLPVLAFELICVSGVCSAPLMQWIKHQKKRKLKHHSSSDLSFFLAWVSDTLLCAFDQLQNQALNTFLETDAQKGRSFPRGELNSILKEARTMSGTQLQLSCCYDNDFTVLRANGSNGSSSSFLLKWSIHVYMCTLVTFFPYF